ncbi:MAG: outer membrane lipoprotein carrier protein LolA [Pseudomonadota bacterium]
MSIAMISAFSLIYVDALAPTQIVADPVEPTAIEDAIPAAAPTPDTTALPIAETDTATDLTTPPVDIAGTPPASVLPDIPSDDLADVRDPDLEPLVYADLSDDDVAELVMDYLEELETISGDFVQTAPSGAVSSGRFYIRRPGFLRFEYNPPSPLLIIANGGMVYVQDEALDTTDSYPAGRTPLKFLLEKRINRDKAKIVAVDRGVDSAAVTFASTDDETEGELSVIVTAPEMSLSYWIVRDLQNGVTVVDLDNVKTGERLSNRLFETPDAGGTFLKN